MKHIFTYLLISFIPAFIFAQNATISGKVTDEKQEPLFPANVIIDASKGWATQTDFEGRFTLSVPEGRHKIAFSYLGKETVEKEVSVSAGETHTINVKLATTAKELQIVTVTGGKYEKSFGEEIVSIEVVSPHIIENNIAQATEVLNRVPGYTQIGESPSIRGGSSFAAGASSRILFLIDGVPQLSPENGAIFFETMPLENIQQIEVIKGASSALYGSGALNGIINFRTAWPTDSVPFRRITSAIGVYQKFTSNLISSKNDREHRMKNPDWWWKEYNHLPVFINKTYEHRQKFEKVDLVLGAHYRHDHGFRKDNEIDRFRINGKIRHVSKKIEGLIVGSGWNFAYEEGGQFFLWSGLDERALLPSDPLNTPNILNPNQGVDVRTDVVQRRISVTPFVTYYDKKENRHQINTRYYNNQSTNFGLEQMLTNHIYGEYTFSKENVGRGLNVISGLSGFYTKTEGITFGDVDYGAYNLGAFVQAERKFFEKLTVSGGLRAEFNQIDSITPQNKLPMLSFLKKDGPVKSPVKPVIRFGANYEVVKGTYIRGGFGQGFRVPTINEYFINTQRGLQVVPNPTLLPEAGWNAELGIKQGVKVGGWTGFFDAVGFLTRYNDMIEFELQSFLGPIQAVNVDDAQISGFELSALGQGSLFGYPLNFLAGYSFINPILLNPTESRRLIYPETYQYLNYRSKHSVKADIETTVKKFTFGFSSLYNSHIINMPVTQTLVAGITDYRELNNRGFLVFDIRSKFEINQSSNVAFVVKNLFNNEYSMRPGILEAPRNYSIQYQYAF
jgi:outer membrane receptor protein involved in Fe transport